jgi:hypothetical protein
MTDFAGTTVFTSGLAQKNGEIMLAFGLSRDGWIRMTGRLEFHLSVPGERNQFLGWDYCLGAAHRKNE